MSIPFASEKCRARFWHAERNTLPERLDNEHAAALKDQQARRAPCTCDAGGGAEEEYVPIKLALIHCFKKKLTGYV